MNLDDVVKELIKHNEQFPRHPRNCPCMDIHVVTLHTFTAEQGKKIQEQLEGIMRMSINWGKLRGKDSTDE